MAPESHKKNSNLLALQKVRGRCIYAFIEIHLYAVRP